MESFYIKQRVSKFVLIYHRITKEGNITALSCSRRSISNPKTVMIGKTFEVISKEEFDKKYNEFAT
jgi:hypothetical protein